jgi:hypothetical protein
MSEFGTATWSGCDFKSQELCRFREPRVVAERADAIKTSLDRGKLFVSLRQIHMIHPVRRSADGPGGKQTLLLRRSLMPSVQAAPLPLFGSRDPIRLQGISFQELEKRTLSFKELAPDRTEQAPLAPQWSLAAHAPRNFPFQLGKPTGEVVFGGGDTNFKTLAPAGKASRGRIGRFLLFAPCRLARHERTF